MFSTRDDETFTGGDIDIILPNDVLKAQLSPGTQVLLWIYPKIDLQHFVNDVGINVIYAKFKNYVSCEGFTLFVADPP